MDKQEVKAIRITRSREERIAEIDAKIAKHQKDIASLEAKKENLLNPPARKGRIGTRSIVEMAKAAGLTDQEIAERLGLTI